MYMLCMWVAILWLTRSSFSFAAKEGSWWWEFCGLIQWQVASKSTAENPLNNVRKTSRSLAYTDRWFNKWNSNKLDYSKRQRSFTYDGERVECYNHLWFNNKSFGSWYRDNITLGVWWPYADKWASRKKTIWKNFDETKFFVANEEAKTESVCYSEFSAYAADIWNYTSSKTSTVAWKDWGRDRFDFFLQKWVVSKDQFPTYESFAQYIASYVWWLWTAVKDFDHKDIRHLQSAVNLLGCDEIMLDGKLWNYTIKSFCLCVSKKACIQVEEKALWDLKTTEGQKPLIPDVFTDISILEACKEWKMYPWSLECLLNVAPIQDYPKWEEAPFCCAAWQPMRTINMLVDGKLVSKKSCCIKPTDPDFNKCLNTTAKEINTCWPWAPSKVENCEYDENWDKFWDEKTEPLIPICPCDSGVFRENKPWENDTPNWSCPCVKDPASECVQSFIDNMPVGESCVEGEKFGSCDTKVGRTNVRICPCADWNNRVKQADWTFSCPCWPNQIRNNANQCQTCEEWKKPNARWDACECNDWCCWIKLNTNVPWIWRCIEFGNTNNKDRKFTDDYNNGNTTITVNILNAFPLLMWWLGKILLTVLLLFSFGSLIYAGMLRTTDGVSNGNAWDAKKIIRRVVIWIALLWASGVILHMINPNFFW